MGATSTSKLNKYLDEVARGFQPNVKAVLPQITNPHCHLMAIRGYVKHSQRMQRWPFTDAEEAEFKKTNAYRELEREKNRIIKTFETQNPGYSLKGSSKARNLQTQIRFWNGNPTVLALGRNLELKAFTELAKDTYTDPPTEEAVGNFERWLSEVRLRATVEKNTYTSPTHATPGLSSHGQIRAIDFMIYEKGRLVAGTVTATAETVWDTPKWTEKLKQAVQAVSSNWEGPLPHPYEPWHYTYLGN